MKVAIDSSFLLEIILNRPKALTCSNILNTLRGEIGISILTVHHAYYFGIKEHIELDRITELLSDFSIFISSASDYIITLQIIADNDFEDALQIACALNNSCDQFFTLDRRLRKLYKGLLEIYSA